MTAVKKLTATQQARCIEVVPDFVPDHERLFWQLMEDFYEMEPIVQEYDGVRHTVGAGGARRPRERDAYTDFVSRTAEDIGRKTRDEKNLPPWSPTLGMLAGMVYVHTGVRPEYVGINLYRDQHDYVAYHTDPEMMAGPTADDVVLATVSFGAMRRLSIKPIDGSSPEEHIEVPSGSLYVMRGQMQRYWLHAVAPAEEPCGPRMSVVFLVPQTSPRSEQAWILAKTPKKEGEKLLRLMRRRRTRGGGVRTPDVLFMGSKEEVLPRWVEEHEKLGDDELLSAVQPGGRSWEDIQDAARDLPELHALMVEKGLITEDDYEDPPLTADQLKDAMRKYSTTFLGQSIAMIEEILDEREAPSAPKPKAEPN